MKATTAGCTGAPSSTSIICNARSLSGGLPSRIARSLAAASTRAERTCRCSGPDVWEDIADVAEGPRHHTGNRYSDRSLFGGRGPKGEHSRACHICGEVGHIKRDCPDNDKFSGGGGGGGGGGRGGGRSRLQCYNCAEIGHIASMCPVPQMLQLRGIRPHLARLPAVRHRGNCCEALRRAGILVSRECSLPQASRGTRSRVQDDNADGSRPPFRAIQRAAR